MSVTRKEIHKMYLSKFYEILDLIDEFIDQYGEFPTLPNGNHIYKIRMMFPWFRKLPMNDDVSFIDMGYDHGVIDANFRYLDHNLSKIELFLGFKEHLRKIIPEYEQRANEKFYEITKLNI